MGALPFLAQARPLVLRNNRMPKDRAATLRALKKIETPEDMRALLKDARPLSWYRPGREINVSDKMQSRYSYKLSAAPGDLGDLGPLEDLRASDKRSASRKDEAFLAAAERFAKEALDPGEMLRRGVFEGKYLNDGLLEFPREWYRDALNAEKLAPGAPDPSLNEFGVKSRKSIKYWKEKGWIPITEGDRDVRGWFQWYCRYWVGRRQPEVDRLQIMRWHAFKRHRAQIEADYRRMTARGETPPRTRAQKRGHRARQRQGLLQWAYDPYT